MKKKSVFIALAALLSLWGCGPGDTPANGNGNNGAGTEVVTGVSVDSDEVRSRLGFEKQLLIAAVPFEGPILYQQGEEKVGPEAELGRAIHARVQEELGEDIRLVWVNKTAYGSLMNSVARGDQHLGMGVLGITEERQRSVDFSESYYTSQLVVAYNPIIKVVNSDRLQGLKIGVRAGTAAAAFVEAQYPESTIAPDETSDDLVLSLRRGELDAIIDDRLLLSFSLATVAGAKALEIDEKVLGEIPVGIALPKGSTWMRELVNEVIAGVEGDDRLAGWMDEHITDEIEAVDRRDNRREAASRRAQEPRRIIVRLSKDPAFSFDQYRWANLPWIFRNTADGTTTGSSRVNFQGGVGVARLSLRPGTYRFRLQKWDQLAGTLRVTPADPARITLNVRLTASGQLSITRN